MMKIVLLSQHRADIDANRQLDLSNIFPISFHLEKHPILFLVYIFSPNNFEICCILVTSDYRCELRNVPLIY